MWKEMLVMGDGWVVLYPQQAIIMSIRPYMHILGTEEI